ncbi:MAG: tyrosine--tRNA ligase [Planctomycetota bacterium]
MFPSVEEQLKKIKRGTVDVFPEQELIDKLKRSREENRPLRIKLGIDPTSKDIQLGNAVPLWKLRHFQDLGHQAVLIIGDYTAMVGDPSDKDKTRPMLTHEAVMENAQTYLDQMGKIIHLDRTEIVKNGDWFSAMKFSEVIQLAAKMTVARMLERDNFAKRYAAGDPISIHEFIYALMQGYDSVMVRSDVEIGGSDQTFNLTVGRDLQKDAGQEQQVCVTLPMLVGLDGAKKMSKSLGNYIGITDAPKDMFGKTMSIPDNLMRDWFELTSDVDMGEVDRMLRGGANPRDVKAELGKAIVRRYYGEKEAEEAAAEFNRVFREHELPEEIPDVTIPARDLKDGKIWIAKLIVACGFAQSNGEAKRLVKQGGVTIDGDAISDDAADLDITDGMLLKVGKRRFARIYNG